MAGDTPTRTDALNFGRRLRLFRKQRGLTQSELGAVISVDQTTISGWERSAEPPRDWFVHADAIAAALGIAASALESDESPRERAMRVAEEALDYGTAQPRSEDAVAVTPRPGSETTQQMIRRHFPNASPEEFEELQALVARFMQHNIQEMRAINRVGDVIMQLAKERSGEGGGDEDGESAEDAKRKPFRGPPEEFHGERFLETIRQAL